MRETDEKVQRLQQVAREAQVDGILLTAQHNFAWLTGGGTNRIDGSREAGAGALLVGANGRRFVLANTIEMPRLLDEELAGLGFEAVEFPWVDERADAALLTQAARRVLGTPGNLGADLPITGALTLESSISRARARLTSEEIERYRILGRDAGEAVGAVCRALSPGLEEKEIGRRIADALAAKRARAIVLLVGADDRLARYRHPVATPRKWTDVVLVAACAERGGLVVSLSRIVAARMPGDLQARTEATARVFGRMLCATRDGAVARDIFAATVRAYEEAGFPGEERKHHQGGATGYRSRDWVAHPSSDEVVLTPQAFAWNPTITGSKVEETLIVHNGAVETLSASPGWPSIPIKVNDQELAAPGVLEI